MRLTLIAQATAVVGALALVLLATASDANAAATFNPDYKFVLTPATPETPSDSIVDLNIKSGDVNFAAVVAYIPSDWGIVTGENIQVGAQVGFLSSKATLGLIGSACNQLLEPEFNMLNASIDIKDTVSFEDLDNNGTRDYADDDTGDRDLFKAITKYPEFISRLFEKQSDLQPIRRSAAITPVAGIPVILQFVVFPPGTLIDKDIPHGKELGFPSVTLLQNAGDPDVKPEPGAITDFCTPLISHSETYGVTKDNKKTTTKDEAGQTVQVNPKDGKYNFSALAFGQRDGDGDGYENSLDTCPYVQNDGDPRISNDGDLDGDGLDSACDPNDNSATGGTNSDQDTDGYLNRQDNCPLISNGQDTTNQHDIDRDQIGDACDKTPGTVDGDTITADGKLIPFQAAVEAVIGTGAGPDGPPSNAPGTACDGKCWVEGWTPGGTSQTKATTPPASATPGVESDDGGLSTGAVIGIVAGVAAIVAVIGAGAYVLMRRRGGGTTPPTA